MSIFTCSWNVQNNLRNNKDETSRSVSFEHDGKKLLPSGTSVPQSYSFYGCVHIEISLLRARKYFLRNRLILATKTQVFAVRVSLMTISVDKKHSLSLSLSHCQVYALCCSILFCIDKQCPLVGTFFNRGGTNFAQYKKLVSLFKIPYIHNHVL